jgi:hypothetical protein
MEVRAMGDKHEMMTSWHGSGRPNLLAWSDRTKAMLMGTAKGRRHVPGFRPFDLLAAPNQQLVILENEDQQIGVEAVVGAQQEFLRYVDFDAVYFQFAGSTVIETEFGVYEMHPAEMMLVPEGIAHRAKGTADCLRYFAKVHAPITEAFDEGEHTGRTEFDVIRHGGPDWTIPAHLADAPKDRVVERMITWGEAPGDETLIERNYTDLVGATSLKRNAKESGIKKFRAFDVFKYMTGVGKGPGPKIMLGKHFMAEVYNTVGEQHSFHRALRSEEIGLQFRGNSINMSEFDARHEMPPGMAGVVPLGIAHCVGECGPDFLRVVLYSDLKWKVRAAIDCPAYTSTFEVRTRVIEAPSWQQAAAE